jgi:predicted MFS family arabinose efflux permease
MQTAAAARKGHSGSRTRVRHNTLIATSLGIAAIPLSVALAGVALEPLRHELGGNLASLQWVLNAFMLSYAALLVPAGSLADRRGRRRVFMAGLAVYVLSPIICGLAPNLMTLILGRFGQGVAAAMVGASGLSLLAEAFTDPAERKMAFGVMGGTLGVGFALGAAAGGALIDAVGWRMAFFAQASFSLIPFAFAFGMRESHDEATQTVDWIGSALGFAALAGWMVLGILGPSVGWTSHFAIALLFSALLLSIIFVLVESRMTAPMVEFELFANARFTGASLLVLAITACTVAVVYFVPLYLQTAGGFSPTKAGSLMLFMLLPAAVTPFLVGWLGRDHSTGMLLGTGSAIMAIGFVAMASGLGSGFLFRTLAGLVVLGIGSGFISGLIEATAMSASPIERTATGSGIFDAIRIVGNSAGAIIPGGILAASVATSIRASSLGSAIPDANLRAVASSFVTGDVSGAIEASGLKSVPTWVPSALAGYGAGMSTVMVLLALVCGFAAVFSIVVFRRRQSA